MEACGRNPRIVIKPPTHIKGCGPVARAGPRGGPPPSTWRRVLAVPDPALLIPGLLTLALFISPSWAAPLDRSPEVHRTVLANGLTLLVVPRHQAPVFSAIIMVRAGAMDEPAGATGVAHMMEHMAFKGTRHVGTRNFRAERRLMDELDRAVIHRQALESGDAGAEALTAADADISRLEKQAGELTVHDELGQLYARNGGVGLNATTGPDYTVYFVSLPAGRLPLWASLESERMARPVFRDFYRERGVVLEERRMRVDSQPSGRFQEQFMAAAFIAHPYRNPVIGWESDIEHLTRPQAETFFRDHYTPGNTVIALVGDVDPEAALTEVQNTFGQIPARPIRTHHITPDPSSLGPRRVTVLQEESPALLVGFPAPGVGHPDDAVMDVINHILGIGSASRLRHALVMDRQMAIQAGSSSGIPGSRSESLFLIQAIPLSPGLLPQLEQGVFQELAKLRDEPVSEAEMASARTRLEASLIRSWDSNMGLARGMAWAESIAGGWRYLFTLQEEIARVTPEDVQRVARRYLTPEHAVVGVSTATMPGGGPGGDKP